VRRYRFRLEQVLRVRRQEQDAARGAVLAATARTQAEAQALVERDEAYTTALGTPGPRSAADFVRVQQHRAALGRAVLDQRSRVQGAESCLEQARAGWSAAAMRVGALERLDERQRAEHTARAAKEEEMVVDDLVVSRSALSRLTVSRPGGER
jgi:flagellar export protein FliJ